MTSSRIIGLDLGTTTVTGVLLDAERGEVLCLARRRNDAALRSTLSIRAEQDPHRLRALALEVLAELAAIFEQMDGGRPVEGLALTGQKHGLLCVDVEGRPLTPLISWQDQRTAEPWPGGAMALDDIHTRTADLDWRENGCRLAHGYGAASLFWLAQRGDLPPDTHQVCTPASWLAGHIGGQPLATDPTFAASWGVYNLVTGAWNTAFLDRLDLEPRLFPPVRPSGERLGRLVPEVARQVGLPVGLSIYNALGDTQASFIGSVTDAEHAVLLNLGTGGQICWMVPGFEPPSEAVETRPLPPGRFLRVGASLCGGAAYDWLNHSVRAWLADFGLEIGEEAVYERLNTLAATSGETDDLQVRTTFLGVRGDPGVLGGAIEGITLENLRLGPLARATLVGIIDELFGLYRAHANETARHRHVVASGGLVERNRLLPELIEERFGLAVGMPPHRESAAVGAALVARNAVA